MNECRNIDSYRTSLNTFSILTVDTTACFFHCFFLIISVTYFFKICCTYLRILFISHDLSVVEHISDTVGVMYLGNLVEYGATPDIFSHPLHPYTKALFSAIPIPDPTIRRERIVLQGSIPSPANPPKGCKFHTRCPYATERCKTEAPQQREVEPGHYVVCHLYEK